jgi:hypothetical protein
VPQCLPLHILAAVLVRVDEGDVDVFAAVPSPDFKPALKLTHKEGLAVTMASDEVSTLPVVA